MMVFYSVLMVDLYSMQRINQSNKDSWRWVNRLSLMFVFLLAATVVQPVLAQSRGITLSPVERPTGNVFDQGVYRALIIGNDDYDDPQDYWPSLKTAVSDARAVAEILKHGYGFSDVVVLENSTRRETLHALNDLSRRVQPHDNVLVYYAGHGFLDANTQRGYWVPSDAEGTDHATFLRNSTIRDEIGIIATRAKHTLLISDSCFSGTLLRGGLRGAAPSENAGAYYQKVANKKSVQVLTAGGVEYVDDDYQASGHSPFSYFLINELKHNEKPLLTASELASNVEKGVANNVDQVPASGVLQGAGDELGEFIFLKLNVMVDGIDEDRVKVEVNVVPKQETSPKEQDSPPANDAGYRQPTLPLPSL